MNTHPHDFEAAIPDRLSVMELRELSHLSPTRALAAVALEWLAIAAAITVATLIGHSLATLAAIVIIGARQHALLVIAHDASHMRFLPNRRWNDAVANLLLAWPMFISVQGFRHFHGPHHRFLGGKGDGNRTLWSTHDAQGTLCAEWRYPKTPGALTVKILRHVVLGTGLWWILRGLVGGFQFGVSLLGKVSRAAFYVAVATALSLADAWSGFLWFWVIPYCTWHVAVQYIRLICEHSNISGPEGYHQTRTTMPTVLEGLFVLPRHIGYHIEHHWYPSVPFYRLPALHMRLMREVGFAAHARISRSVWCSLREVMGFAETLNRQ